jgi:small GTP-binding protein
VQSHPTIGSNYEELNINNVHLQTWDLGGQESLRKIWDTYYKGTHAIVFVIDSSDKNSHEKSKAELQNLFSNEEIKNCVFLVLANKQDLEGSLGTEEIIKIFNLQDITQNTWSIYGISVKTGHGVNDAFDWLIDQLSIKNKDI